MKTTPRAIKMREKKAERAAAEARMAEARREARREAAEALKACRCPRCGAGTHRNLALTGWVQCDRFGSEGFRKDPTGPQCGWQGFTE